MKKILVRVPHWLGDAVVSTIFLSRLKAQNPQSEIHVLTPEYINILFKTHPAVSGTILLPNPYRYQVKSVGQNCKSHGFDELYVLPRSVRTALEAWFSGIPVRVGFGGAYQSLAFNKRFSYDKKLRYPHRYLKLIGEEELDLSQQRPHFPSEPPVDKNFKEAKKPILIVAPSSIAPARTWDEERFVKIIRQFQQEKKGTVILGGSKKEEDLLLKIKNQCGENVLVDAGYLTFPEVGWMMSQASALVCNDSGLMHVASAFQVPSLVLFGASDPNVALPVSPEMRALQRKDISCVPCYRNQCVRFGPYNRECLTSLSVDEVWKSLLELNWRN